MDKRSQHELDRMLDGFGLGLRFVDKIAPAIYQLEPGPPKTAIVCMRHDPPYVALVPSIPRVAALRWTCAVCGFVIFMEPPEAVLEYEAAQRPRAN